MLPCIYLLAMLAACTSHKDNSVESKYAITFDDSDTVDVRSLVTDVEVIELEMTNDAFAPNITNISVHGDKIFCLAADKGGSVKVFDLNGKYLYQISHTGRAVNEWIRLGAMYINAKENAIYLTDDESKKVLTYTLDGTFVKSVKLGDSFCFQVIHDDGYYYSLIHPYMSGYKLDKHTDHKIDVYDDSGSFSSANPHLPLLHATA